MSIYMESTKIPAERTAQEIERLLAEAGATQVLKQYDKDRKLRGFAFTLNVNNQEVPFELPARTEPIFRYLQRLRSPQNREKGEAMDRERSEWVAWRQILKWIQAQLALIDTGMVEAAEVFSPYRQISPGVTLWEYIKAGRLALPEAK
jgi:hypothetical protein